MKAFPEMGEQYQKQGRLPAQPAVHLKPSNGTALDGGTAQLPAQPADYSANYKPMCGASLSDVNAEYKSELSAETGNGTALEGGGDAQHLHIIIKQSVMRQTMF